MRITSPMFACPLLRPFGVGGRNRLGISVLSAWTLSGAPLSVQDLWPRFMRAAGADTVLDQGVPKSASEYLLVGHAHSTQPVTHLAASVDIGGRRKTVNVIGDRTWRRGVPTPPEPFTRMPLSWDRAFGGPGFAHNPVGRGFVTGDPEGAPLPNLEGARLIRSPSDRPEPAGFGAFALDWSQRMRGLGTYDARWFEHEFPGFASDIDWRVHNIAPIDQRFDEPFTPGTPIALHNVVEDRPRVDLVVPRVTARCFTYGREEPRHLEEVPLTLRTLWLVPDEDMIVLVFHGAQSIATMLASEISGVLVALDASDRPRDAAHFEHALDKRLGRELGAVEMLDDRPLMPEGMRFPDFEERAADLTLPSRTGALEANLYAGAELRRQEALKLFAEAGFQGGEALFPPLAPPAPSKLPVAERIRESLEEGETKRKEAEAKLAELRAQAIEELEKAGFDPSFLDKERAGPPPILAATQIELLQEIVREARAAGRPLEVFERQLDDPDFHRELFEREAQGREAYRLSAHHTDALPDVDVDRMHELRVLVEAAVRDGVSLAQADLTCADLADLDLSGVDLTGAWLEGANLQKTNLTGARLDGAVLAKANLGEAVFDRTSLRRANLGKARLTWTRLDACDLEEAILDGADLRGAIVTRSRLRGADLMNLRVESARFSECDLRNLTFLHTSLAGLSFDACTLDGCNFIEVTLDDASFRRCRLDESAFVTCRGARTSFYEARLENARFVSDCKFDEADFRRASMPRSTLRSCRLSGACFDEADLSDSDVSQGVFENARFYRADLRRVLATECDLRSAMMAGANLMSAILQGADLRGADLRGSNLFAADLALVRADRETSLAGALVTRVREKPLRAKETS